MPADPLMLETLEEIGVAINEMIDEVMAKKMPREYADALGKVLASIGTALSLLSEDEIKTN